MGTKKRTGPRAALVVFAAVSLWATPVTTRDQGAPEALSIVRIVEVETGSRGVGSGTGFIVSAAGAIVTQAHVVANVRDDPAQWGLIVLWDGPNGREFFGADLVCATKYVPGSGGFARDAANLRIALPVTRFRAWSYTLPDGLRYTWVRHKGPLPVFPTLHMADHGPSEGEQIHAPGYGDVSAFPRLFTWTGRVEWKSADGTPFFEIRFTNPVEPGESGSPILNAQGKVVGLMGWYDATERDKGFGQDVSVVRQPCKSK